MRIDWHVSTLLAVCAALAFACITPVHAQALKPLRDPAVESPAALWDDVLARGTPDDVLGSYIVLEELWSGETVDTTRCAANAAALDDALRDNPVGMALWWVAYQCAEAGGDTALADARMASLGALMRHAIQSTPADHGMTPIRIMVEADMMAMIEASGWELLYVYYETNALPLMLPIRVAVWDPGANREHHLSFDALDTLVRLQRDASVSTYPAFRTMFALSYLGSLAKSMPDSPAGEAMALRAALAKPTMAERLRETARLADASNISAMVSYGYFCLVWQPSAGCADHAVDLMLPLAELRLAEPLLLLAHAHWFGDGVKRDKAAAKAMFTVADERLGGIAALRMAAMTCSIANGERCVPDFARKSFRALVDVGDPLAEALWVQTRVETVGLYKLKPTEEQRLRHSAEAGVVAAQSALGVLLLSREGASEQALHWLDLASRRDVRAAVKLAQRYERADGVPRDVDRAAAFHARAAHLGRGESARWLGRRELERLALPVTPQPPWLQSHWWTGERLRAADLRGSAQLWFQGGMQRNHVASALALAQVYMQGGDGVDAGPQAAESLLETLSGVGSAAARRELARLRRVEGGSAADIAEARRLLAADASEGRPKSQRLLGRALVRARDDSVSAREGREWLRAAADAGDADAADDLATALAAGHGGAVDSPGAKALWAEWSSRSLIALNNLAWLLCTSPDAAVFDPAEGSVAAERLQQLRVTGPAWLDTVATCHAAAGRFDEAIALQTRVVSDYAGAADMDVTRLDAMRERLTLYRSGRRYEDAVFD